MSLAEEDTELQDMLTQTLEANGCLAKLRAELRANLFLTLNEDQKISKQELNPKLKEYAQHRDGQIMFHIVQEFLEYFGLNFSVAVLESESSLSSLSSKYEGRQKLVTDLGIVQNQKTGPILLELLKIAQTQIASSNKNASNVTYCEPYSVIANNGDIEAPSNGVNDNANTKIEELNDTFVIATSHFTNCVLSPIGKTKCHNNISKTDRNNPETEAKSITEECSCGTSNFTEKISVEEEITYHNKSQPSNGHSSKPLDSSSLQLNKSSKVSEILPSLYTKEFKEKSNSNSGSSNNSKDLDTDFDIKDDYEEDFMPGSETDFPVQKVFYSESKLNNANNSLLSESSVLDESVEQSDMYAPSSRESSK